MQQPTMAVPDLNKFSGVATLCMCKAIFVYTSKAGQYDVLSVGTFTGLAHIMTSQVAGYEKCVVPVFYCFLANSCMCILAKLWSYL